MAEPQAPDARASGLGLFDSVKAVLATIVAILHNRLELVSAELQEEVARLALLLLFGAVALFSAFLALAALGLVVLIAFWEEHRLLVAVLLAAWFLILALLAGYAARAQMAAKPRPFDASLNELAKDREQLKPRL